MQSVYFDTNRSGSWRKNHKKNLKGQTAPSQMNDTQEACEKRLFSSSDKVKRLTLGAPYFRIRYASAISFTGSCMLIALGTAKSKNLVLTTCLYIFRKESFPLYIIEMNQKLRLECSSGLCGSRLIKDYWNGGQNTLKFFRTDNVSALTIELGLHKGNSKMQKPKKKLNFPTFLPL